mmetsp:Transcript_48729/g.128882  ORF Transcript_48729/g.128882 Transcript_48729/m.128882 type:complete len:380 (-) Transcript_48729:130-1269(-)
MHPPGVGHGPGPVQPGQSHQPEVLGLCPPRHRPRDAGVQGTPPSCLEVLGLASGPFASRCSLPGGQRCGHHFCRAAVSPDEKPQPADPLQSARNALLGCAAPGVKEVAGSPHGSAAGPGAQRHQAVPGVESPFPEDLTLPPARRSAFGPSQDHLDSRSPFHPSLLQLAAAPPLGLAHFGHRLPPQHGRIHQLRGEGEIPSGAHPSNATAQSYLPRRLGFLRLRLRLASQQADPRPQSRPGGLLPVQRLAHPPLPLRLPVGDLGEALDQQLLGEPVGGGHLHLLPPPEARLQKRLRPLHVHPPQRVLHRGALRDSPLDPLDSGAGVRFPRPLEETRFKHLNHPCLPNRPLQHYGPAGLRDLHEESNAGKQSFPAPPRRGV